MLDIGFSHFYHKADLYKLARLCGPQLGLLNVHFTFETKSINETKDTSAAATCLLNKMFSSAPLLDLSRSSTWDFSSSDFPKQDYNVLGPA